MFSSWASRSRWRSGGGGGAALRRGVLTFEPGTYWEDDLYARALTLVGELDQNRALRLLEVREGIPSILWVVLILGGATTVCFTYLLGVRTGWLHVLMTAAYTLVLALTLFTIGALDNPPSTASLG